MMFTKYKVEEEYNFKNDLHTNTRSKNIELLIMVPWKQTEKLKYKQYLYFKMNFRMYAFFFLKITCSQMYKICVS